MQPNLKTLGFYRRLLKTMMKSFQNDYNMFHKLKILYLSCRLEARKKILENQNENDIIKIQNHIFYGEEIRDFLEKNILQANLQESGNYRIKIKKENSLGTNVKPYNDE